MNDKLSKTDLHLLFELGRDCRQSLKQLAKKTGSKKSLVAYKIKRLEKKGIIKGYYTLIDNFLLDYESYRIYFTLQNTNPTKEAELINFLKKEKKAYFISSMEGRFNLVVFLWIKSHSELFSFFDSLMRQFRYNIKDYLLTPYSSILLEGNYLNKKSENFNRWTFSEGEKISVNDLDNKILRKISYDAKIPLVKISKELHALPNTIKYRIKRLKDAKIIKAFRADINFSLLGYVWYKVDMNLNTYAEYDKILSQIATQPNSFVIAKSIGLADIEAEFHFKNDDELTDLLNKFKIQFPDSIKDCSVMTVREIIKISFAPGN
jgi:DNA-binding Lrp family transcriptional regulator